MACAACPSSSSSNAGCSVFCNCPVGQYWDAVSFACIACPSGNECKTSQVLFNETSPGSYSFIVPLGVSSLSIEASGAEGGVGSSDGHGASPVYAGGLGGYIKATISVTPGQTLYINVGQHPTTSGDGLTVFNGGGYFGGCCSFCCAYVPGYGGGATDVRTSQNDLNSRLIVAGGGGGGGMTGAGGAGGGSTGGNGKGSSGPGSGGTMTEGGSGGPYTGCCDCGLPGSFGVGGQATWGGGGGGGGWYGGGGGGQACGRYNV